MKLKPIRSLIAGMSFAVAMTLNPVQAHMTDAHQGMMGMHGGMMHGQGMMGPSTMGPGMMGPGMMGPGMAGGCPMMGGMMGMHGGMMHGQGMTMGGMGSGAAAILNLNEAQQEKLTNLQQNQAKQQWQLMQQLVQQRSELAQLSSTENPDTQAVGAAYDKLANLQKQMFLNNLETQQQFRALLTDEQRNTLQQMRQMGWGGW